MDQAIYDRKVERILDRLDRHIPSCARPCSNIELWVNTFRTLRIAFLPTLLPLCLLIFHGPMPTKSLFAGCFALFCLGWVGAALLWGVSSLIERFASRSISLEDFLVRHAWGAFRRGFVVSEADASLVTSFCRSHPRATEAVTRWVSFNEASTLTSREFDAIAVAKQKIKTLQASWDRSAEDRAQAASVSKVLKESQILDRAMVLREARQLNAQTQGAPVETTVRPRL